MDLPAEVIPEILVRLPVRALLRCRSVCRSWRSLIGSPYFIASHLKRSTAGPPRSLIATYMSGTGTDYFISLLCVETLGVLRRVEIPGVNPRSYPTVVSSVNGVVCLLSGYRMSLLNPATRDFRDLEDPTCTMDDPRDRHCIGFGYSRRIDDHKLVRIRPLEVGYEAHIFSLGEGVWRQVEAPASSLVMRSRVGTAVDGVVHWIVGRDGSEAILSFDLGTDSFGQQSLPDVGGEGGVIKSLSEFDGSLRLIVHPDSFGARSLTVWGRDSRYVWTRLMRIDQDPGGSGVVGWGSSGELFMEYDYRRLVAYEPTTRVFRDVEVDAEKRPSYVRFRPYRESLVPLR